MKVLLVLTVMLSALVCCMILCVGIKRLGVCLSSITGNYSHLQVLQTVSHVSRVAYKQCLRQPQPVALCISHKQIHPTHLALDHTITWMCNAGCHAGCHIAKHKAPLSIPRTVLEPWSSVCHLSIFHVPHSAPCPEI